MLLSHKTTVKLNDNESNILGHLCYAAYKLWNVCNYERKNYRELGMEEYPDWYYQKKSHKDDLWFKSLPSQTAQEVCKQLDKAWKSYTVLLKTNGIENPHPPRFKQDPMEITYMQNGIVHVKGEDKVRLSLPKKLKEYMRSEYGIEDNYLYLENQIFQDTDTIKQIKMYPPEDSEAKVIVIYEVKDVMPVEENGHYLSIDLGLHNLFTCYDSEGKTFIAGRKYLNICYRYDKEIARIQSQWSRIQSSKGVKYPKSSKHLKNVYLKKQNSMNDYLHKVTRLIAEYCRTHDISVVVIGDIRNIRRNSDLGHMTNQKLHSLPYSRIYEMLSYKLALYGILMIREKETYTSQCSPYAPSVSKTYADKKKRVMRGLYKDGGNVFNADAVGAFNILRKYLKENEKEIVFSVKGISDPIVIRAAV